MRFSKHIVLIAAMAAMVAVGRAEMEPGSFLTKIAPTTTALIAQVKAEPVVMDRYMRHFAMSREELVTYLKSLRLTTTKSDGLYVVYGAPRTGTLRSRLLKLKKGTKVFVDEAGEVVLLWHCGNPVTRGPKVPYDVRRPSANPSGVAAEELREINPDMPAPMLEANMITMGEPGLPDIPIIPTPNENEIPIVPSVGGNFLSFLPVLAVIGSNGGNNNPPVPEPASMAVLGVGAAALLARRRKR